MFQQFHTLVFLYKSVGNIFQANVFKEEKIGSVHFLYSSILMQTFELIYKFDLIYYNLNNFPQASKIKNNMPIKPNL